MSASADEIRSLFAQLVKQGQIYELAHELAGGMPGHPGHPEYSLAPIRRHGEPVERLARFDAGFANERIVMSGHSSTHIDALGHFSRGGRVHGGREASEIESDRGLLALDAAALDPIWSRGLLLDVARHRGVDSMAPGEPVDGEELAVVADQDGLAIEPGDAVLVRTGWARHWDDTQVFSGEAGGWPGPDDDGARWLIERGVRIVGSDTPAFEAIPYRGDSVHAMLLVDHGIPIVENLDLEELGANRVLEFLFVGLPLRLAGATGSPLRPVAIA